MLAIYRFFTRDMDPILINLEQVVKVDLGDRRRAVVTLTHSPTPIALDITFEGFIAQIAEHNTQYRKAHHLPPPL
jgi:hypothetical protein